MIRAFLDASVLFAAARSQTGASREIVRRAIERTGPPRLPVNYCNRDVEDSDTAGVGPAPAAGFTPSQPGETEWGFVWEVLDETMGQPKTHPLADWDCIADYVAPDPYAPGRFDDLADAIAARQDRFVNFGMFIH